MVNFNKFKRFLIGGFIFLFSVFCLTACTKQKTMILFNQNPITKQNVLDNSNVFVWGKRFYYLFISEKPINSDMIRVRVFKRDEKAGGVPNKLLYSNDFRLRKDQVYYYDDYLVINDSGVFCMVIYSMNNLKKPLAVADFKIKR